MAVISGARVAAAHEGDAELIVNIRYSNGGVSEITLDAMASAALMDSCNAASLEQLTGHSWQKVKAALSVSYNRYRV